VRQALSVTALAVAEVGEPRRFGERLPNARMTGRDLPQVFDLGVDRLAAQRWPFLVP
jgi:hypothetical protein